jgi:hypothetical protein
VARNRTDGIFNAELLVKTGDGSAPAERLDSTSSSTFLSRVLDSSGSLCPDPPTEGAPVSTQPDETAPTPAEAKERLEQALFEIRRVIAGQDAMLERVLVCLLSQGHLCSRASRASRRR